MDGQLRSIFSQNLRSAQWTPIESGLTIQGIPDSHYIFPGGCAGWIEHKQTDGWQIKKTKSWPFQVAWISRYTRMDGRVFIAIRRKNDELWLVTGALIRQLADEGLRGVQGSCNVWGGGPSKWNWPEIEAVLKRKL